ncbi:MAG: siphovirus Gp157 family protein [Coriobacteriia bacterium]|nr:siphovirus Gp157 family protein [Coriobacteriia bacterium]
MRLLQITDDMQALDDLLAEVGGDVTDPKVSEIVDAWFAEIDANLTGKVDNYAALITSIRARADIRRAEAERLARRAQVDEASADWLAARLLAALDARGMKKLETDRYAVSVVGNGGKAPLLLDGEVPADWTKTVTRTEPDKERIRLAIEAGQALPFARLGERGKRLAIR